MIIAVDFDGTIVEHKYPKIGKEIPFAIATLKHLQQDGHKLILWTVRENDLLDEAVEFFENIPSIVSKIQTIKDVGLGYITLGQQSTTLSGGEAQRVKLATELSKRDTGNTLYILDEPTTGLHFEDVRVLLEVLQKLVDKGNTVFFSTHVLEVAEKLCDKVAIISKGKLVFDGTIDEMKNKVGEDDSLEKMFLELVENE